MPYSTVGIVSICFACSSYLLSVSHLTSLVWDAVYNWTLKHRIILHWSQWISSCPEFVMHGYRTWQAAHIMSCMYGSFATPVSLFHWDSRVCLGLQRAIDIWKFSADIVFLQRDVLDHRWPWLWPLWRQNVPVKDGGEISLANLCPCEVSFL